jgi:hypothetical protein
VKGGGLSLDLAIEVICVVVAGGVECLAGALGFGDGGGCLLYDALFADCAELDAQRFDCVFQLFLSPPIMRDPSRQKWQLSAGVMARMCTFRRHCSAVRERVALTTVDMVGRGFIVSLLCREESRGRGGCM